VTQWATSASQTVDTEPLRAFLRAGNSVYDAIDAAEARRSELRSKGVDPWAYPPASAAALLCAWNAMVLQTLGESLAGGGAYAAAPLLPRPVFDQAWRVLSQVAGWMACAQRALADPNYRLDGTPLPADLPEWTDAVSPPGYLRGLIEAADSISARCDVAVAAFTASAVNDPTHAADVAKVTGLVTQARAVGDYARSMVGPNADDRVRGEVQGRLHQALTLWFHLGQLLAVPALIGPYDVPQAAPTVAPTPAAAPPPEAAKPGLVDALSDFGKAALLNAQSRRYEDLFDPVVHGGRRYAASNLVRAHTMERMGAAFAMMMPDSDEIPASFVSAAFDIYCLTEPSRRASIAADATLVASLSTFWKSDPAPQQTSLLAQQIGVALADQSLRIATGPDGVPLALGSCPWPPIYDVLAPTVIGGTLLRVGTQVTVRVGFDTTGQFQRSVVTTASPAAG
jgi:hypothetical protein